MESKGNGQVHSCRQAYDQFTTGGEVWMEADTTTQKAEEMMKFLEIWSADFRFATGFHIYETKKGMRIAKRKREKWHRRGKCLS